MIIIKRYSFFFIILIILVLCIPSLSLVNGLPEAKDICSDIENAVISEESEETESMVFSEEEEKKSEAPQEQEENLVLYENNFNIYYKLMDHKTGNIINISASDYIKGVVAAEMPAEFNTEALKAQAVAAHSYAITQRNSSRAGDLKGADFSTDPSKFQAFMGKEDFYKFYGDKADEYLEKISNAVDSVINKILVYDNRPVIAAFHAISGGITEKAVTVWGYEVDYLVPVISEGDSISPGYENKTEISAEKAKKTLTASFSGINLPENKNEWFNILTRTASDTVTSVKVGEAVFTGAQMRSMFTLRSANFTVSYNESADTFVFFTKGYGHGVGMSQYGAEYMARQGKTYEEILLHYYTGVELYTIDGSL